MDNKTFTIVLIVVVILGIAFVLFVPASPKIEIAPSQLLAGEKLPAGVTKFEDGTVRCYVLSKYDLITATRAAGISCVK